jgi:hypothetical protein
MTTRSDVSPVTREATAYVRDRGLRAVIVTVTGSLLELRAKGLRSREVLSIDALYALAIRQRVAFERSEKAKARVDRMNKRKPKKGRS